MLAQHYSLLARKVAERSAATGEHYITRDATAYRAMLRAALGGGAVLGLTTLVDELSAVMTVPGRRSRSATLHMFASGQDLVADASYQTGSNHALAA